jgi:hypothetical protein
MLEGPARNGRLVAPAVVLALFFGAFFAGSARAEGTLTVRYVGCTGMTVTPNPPPAGSTSVLVYDDDNCNASFSLSGPGVSLTTDLNSTGMGIDHPAGPFGPFNFQAGATYTVRDSNISASTSFSPSAAASSSGGSSGSSGVTSGSTAGTTSSGGQTSGSTTSSGGTTTLGTLVGTVSPTGKATLVLGGATVKRLKAGVYKLTISDRSKKAGLIIQALGYRAMSESAVSGTGTRTTTLRVIPARYFFQATGGPKTYFTVSG